ncbi:hypothetical protein KCP71_22620 [Salmonella enterica subsp. enterica]|nr:hypothetical protein KCP71_22620 [Salmonella enterica subsp. enterica]
MRALTARAAGFTVRRRGVKVIGYWFVKAAYSSHRFYRIQQIDFPAPFQPRRLALSRYCGNGGHALFRTNSTCRCVHEGVYCAGVVR